MNFWITVKLLCQTDHYDESYALLDIETPMVSYVNSELRNVIRIFIVEGKNALKIHLELCSVYGEGCMNI